jgi:DNA (cytosine-5)-methyltransferase 1
MHYYNEIDRYAAEWLRNLIAAKLIPAGHVDERDIRDVMGSDLDGYAQCHFFAGIAGWPRALAMAGWPVDRPVWTGSCPCQPFSTAGKRKGESDERHLWPEFRRLIAERKPSTVFGEQVASKDGRRWLAGVRLDLEGLGYAVGAADLCAAGSGAPHIRQRLFWVADASCREVWRTGQPRSLPDGRMADPKDADGGWADGKTDGGRRAEKAGGSSGGVEKDGKEQRVGNDGEFTENGQPSRAEPLRPTRLGDSGGAGSQGRIGRSVERASERPAGSPSEAGGVEKSGWVGRGWRDDGVDEGEAEAKTERSSASGAQPRRGAGFWDAYETIPCTDGKARRIEPGTFPLAHGVPARVGKLRAYGNAIVPQVASGFVRAYLER